MKKKINTTSAHITPAGGNVFIDLGFGPAEAKKLAQRAKRTVGKKRKERTTKGQTTKDMASKKNNPKKKNKANLGVSALVKSKSERLAKVKKIPARIIYKNNLEPPELKNLSASPSPLVRSLAEDLRTIAELELEDLDPGKIDNQEVYDEVDLAQHQQLIELANIVKQIRQRQQQEFHDFDGKHCIDCGDEIPVKRLLATKCARCVDCQEEWERQEKRNR